MFEQKRTVAIEHVAAWSETPWGAAPLQRTPRARDGRPVEISSSPVKIFSIIDQKAHPSGISLEDLKQRVGQGLQNSSRRTTQRLDKPSQRSVFGFVVRGTTWPTPELVGAKDVVQRHQPSIRLHFVVSCGNP